MKKNKYDSVIEIGDNLEFCVVINKVSNVMYGQVVEINKDNRTFTMDRISYGKKMKKELSGEIYKDVKNIRGVGYVNDETWK